MTPATDSSRPFRALLLGELPDDERIALEGRLLADDELFEAATAAELDLVADYVRGALPEAERGRFERHYLETPRGREQLALAQSWALVGEASRRAAAAAPRSWRPGEWRWFGLPGWQMASAAAVLMAVGWVFYSAVEVNQLRNEMASAERRHADERRELNRRLEDSESARQAAAAELARLGQQRDTASPVEPRASGILAFSLAPILRAGDLPPRLLLPARAATVTLELDAETLPVDAGLDVAVRRRAGTEVWRSRARVSDGLLVVSLPADGLVTGGYDVIVELGGKTLASYPFSISRPPPQP